MILINSTEIHKYKLYLKAMHGIGLELGPEARKLKVPNLLM